MTAEEKLKSLAIDLPDPPSPGGNYLSARRAGSLVFLAGVVSIDSGGVITGTVGDGRSLEEGRLAARACLLMQLAVLKKELGSLDAIKEIVSLTGYVSVVPGFDRLAQVIDAASDLLIEIFGEAGKHARATVGASSLPRNALVEIQMVVALRES
jgi:enamine deaminase RidA (YjgF/YER057c/UK114 family)